MPEVKLRTPIPKNLKPAGITTFADLFCGIGGFHYAASSLGLQCVFASDIDEACRQQYQRNFGISPVGDITGVGGERIPDHDILFGGFPCQPFSIIGERNGMNDSRGTLFLEILRILREKRPKAVILENVRQFSTYDKGKTLDQVLRGLESLGYDTDWSIMNALNCGLPQKRERTIIVGLIGGLDNFLWPKAKSKYSSLSSILEKTPDERHFVSETIRAKRVKHHTATVRPAIWHENKAGNISSHPFSCALRAGASYNYLLVDGKRRLTPREMLRLQGFPERFHIIGNDSQIRKQTGNAVPVPMVHSVIRSTLHAASENTRTEQAWKTRALSA